MAKPKMYTSFENYIFNLKHFCTVYRVASKSRTKIVPTTLRKRFNHFT
jgi:hypothetical protein